MKQPTSTRITRQPQGRLEAGFFIAAVPGAEVGAAQGHARKEPRSSLFFSHSSNHPAPVHSSEPSRADKAREGQLHHHPWQEDVELPATVVEVALWPGLPAAGLVRAIHHHVRPPTLVRPRALSLLHM
jgi:hypothetical protein